MTILVADIGGTNTRVALVKEGATAPHSVARFQNSNFDSLSEVLSRYLEQLGHPACDAACVAVAGPIRDGVGRMTNLSWEMDSDRLCAATGASQGFVINDLEAQGHALEDVPTRCLMGTPMPQQTDETRLVVGLGTGFNAAPVHAGEGAHYNVVPSECGHASLPVWNEESLALAQALAREHDFASVEEALSGRGLMAVHRHVAGDAAHETSHALIDALKGDTPRELDQRSIHLFCQILGRVLGDQALIHLPFGGIYLIGGLARAVSPFFESCGLREAFTDKGRFGEFLADFSLYVVEDDYSALTGCARYVRRHS